VTPREGEIIVTGIVRQRRREYNDRITQAYYTAAIPLMKKPPALKDLLVPERGEPRRRKTPQQIKAMLMFALGVKTKKAETSG